MTFNHTAEVLVLMPVVFCAVAIPIGLVIMLIERLTGKNVSDY